MDERKNSQHMKELLKEFVCMKCNYRWETLVNHPSCPKCNHLYLKWLNYALFELPIKREINLNLNVIKNLRDSTHAPNIPHWTTEQLQDAYKQLNIIYQNSRLQ